MPHLLLINGKGPETRVALVENGELAELHIERAADRGIVGNVYKGKVVRVLPGMQAAFVDIGLERAAFLYAGDVPPLVDDQDAPSLGPADEAIEEAPLFPSTPRPTPPIESTVHEGQHLVVQVAKEPIGTKGARVTSYVSLAGRMLVYMPTVDHIGVSRRITDEAERQRLRQIMTGLKPESGGFIVRTVAEHHGEDQLRAEREFLVRLWQDIRARADVASSPALLHQDLDLGLRAARDMVSGQVDRIIVDDLGAYARLKAFVETFIPHRSGILELYQGPEPLFDAHGIEHEIDRALQRKVWLKSGGYLVIDESEALTAIDVNTGRYVGRRNLEDTITKINLEAVKEVVTQLRLRNLGGIIVVDFIDMELESNREKVWRTLSEALIADRAKTNVLEISKLGLVEMTRQRFRVSLMRQLTQPCPYCEGRGYVKSAQTICYDILRELLRQARHLPGTPWTVCVHPEVADLLADAEREHVIEVERQLGKELRVEACPSFHLEQFELRRSHNV